MDQKQGGLRTRPYLQGPALPETVAHTASFQGHPLRLEVNVQGTAAPAQRLKLISHTKECIGQLRRKVAASIGVTASCVRLLYAGTVSRLTYFRLQL